MQKSKEKRKIPRSRKVHDYFPSIFLLFFFFFFFFTYPARLRLGHDWEWCWVEKYKKKNGARREEQAKTMSFWLFFFLLKE